MGREECPVCQEVFFHIKPQVLKNTMGRHMQVEHPGWEEQGSR